MFEAGEEASIGEPHLLQKRVPVVMPAPQELQNAIITSRHWRVGASISQIECEAERESNLAPRPGGIVGHGQPQQKKQKKQRCYHDQLGQLFAGMPDVHEEERD